MLILFDHGTPRGLAHKLSGHDKWSRIRQHIELIVAAINRTRAGGYYEVGISLEDRP